MAAIGDDGAAERLAQARAGLRHARRLRTAERRDAAHERAAQQHTEVEKDNSCPSLETAQSTSAETLTALAAEQDTLALERASLVTDREVDGGIEMGF